MISSGVKMLKYVHDLEPITKVVPYSLPIVKNVKL